VSGGLVFRDYESFKDFHFDIYRQLTKSEVRPLREADIICALDLKKAVEGRCNGRRNMLVSNFFSLLFGLLSNNDMDFKTTAGIMNPEGYRLRTSGDPSYGVSYVVFGTGTTPPSFTDYALVSRSTALEGSVITPTLVISSSEGRARFGRATSGTVYELGIYDPVYSVGVGTYDMMVARSVVSGGIPAGGAVLYDVVFKPPFVHNITRMVFGVMTNANQDGAQDMSGGTYTLNSAGDVNAAAANRLFVGENTAGLDHTVAVPTNPVELDISYYFSYTWGTSYRLMTVGAKKLDAAKTIAEVVLVQNLYSSGGVAVPTVIARWPVSPPVSKSAGEVVAAYAIIYASA
jgi:hypothetical protein